MSQKTECLSLENDAQNVTATIAACDEAVAM